MFEPIVAKLKEPAAPYGDRAGRASVLVPFLIIALAVGVLAWRSYQLSIRMKQGANALAVQYAGYAAEIAASRVDAAVRGELTRASEEWQHIERRTPTPRFSALQDWINNNDWIVSAIYVPDADPANSVYVTELPRASAERKSREFFTPTGTVRYKYDPERLIDRVRVATRQRPLVYSGGDGPAIQQQADVSIVRSPKRPGLERLVDGFAFTSPLAPPLSEYGIRAVVRTSYVGSGWENQGLVSLLLSLGAIALTGLGAWLTWRGLRREAEMMGLRAALIANISHELRTPLSMIRLGAETLRLGDKLRPTEREQIEEQILREVLHLSHLVENVLDVARMQRHRMKALAFTAVSPRELVTSLVATYESWIRSRGFEITVVDADESIDEQYWDREAVSRSVLNLIDNAIKYSADDKAIEIVLRQNAENVVIEVRDRGLGIDAKDLTRIFDPYYRAKFSDTQTRRGAGLGLTLVQQIMGSHGGRVEVDSQPGVGSTFRLLFPKAATTASQHVQELAEARETL